MKTLSCFLTVLVMSLASGLATAKPAADLMRHVPTTSPLIVGFEMSKVRSTFLFGETMKLLEKQAGQSLLGFVLSKKAFDVEKDIDSAVLAFATAPTNPQGPPPAAMAAVYGKFDPARVRSAVEGQFGKLSTRKEKGLTIYSTKGVDFAFVDANTLVITESTFADKTWKAAADENQAASTNKETQALLNLVDTTRGVWFAMNTKAVPSPAGAPAMDGAGIAVDLRSGLALDFRTQFANPADAVKAKAQFEEMKKTTGQDSLITMLGVQPLVANLQASIEKERIVAMQTSMTEAELHAMMKRLKALNEAPPPVAPSTQNGGPTTAPTTTPQPSPVVPGKGTKADFN